ncbi:hypothetical protein V8F06_001554 [Rhypophila decipiens]
MVRFLSGWKAAVLLSLHSGAIAAPAAAGDNAVVSDPPATGSAPLPASESVPKFDPSKIAQGTAIDFDPAKLVSSPIVNETSDFVPASIPVEQPAAGSQKRGYVFGGYDDRHLWTETSFPSSAMGRLLIQTSSFSGVCSAVLVGPRHLVTARHCIKDGASYRFQPAYDNGSERLGYSYATNWFYRGFGESGNCGLAADFAVFILGDRLGDRLGYLGVRVTDPWEVNVNKLWNYGYPADRGGYNRPYRQGSITIASHGQCWPAGPNFSNADVDLGQSGGPMWSLDDDGTRRIHSVLGGVYQAGSTSQTYGAGGQEMVNMVNWLRGDFP